LLLARGDPALAATYLLGSVLACTVGVMLVRGVGPARGGHGDGLAEP
jgi:hypothetical protein